MKETRVALRYAKSLISLALERQILEQIKDDMQTVKSVYDENREFRNMLKSPIVKSDKKTKILNEVFSKELSELSMTFINKITSKKRESILGAIAENFIKLYNEHKNIVIARKSIFASKRIKIGERFTVKNLSLKRPASGIQAENFFKILGKVLASLKAGIITIVFIKYA